MNASTSLFVAGLVAGVAGTAVAQPLCAPHLATDAHVPRTELATPVSSPARNLLVRFAQISDAHILDDDGAILNGLTPIDPVHPVVASAQRLQDEYTDEVLNSMIASINDCGAADPIDFMISTGDNVDLGTVNEVRRFIDNIDGVCGQPSAFDEKCAADLPAGTPPEVADAMCARFTGRGTADTQTVDPDPNDPTYQFTYTRTVRQLLDTQSAVLSGRDEDGTTDPARQTATRAAGLAESLCCEPGAPGCALNGLRPEIPWYAVFGNHDGSARGTVPYEPGMQQLSIVTGRHYMQLQHEFIDEFFKTSTLPVGHGFAEADAARRGDPNPRNDGYYAFDWPPLPAPAKLRMIVLNTLIDGVEGALLDLGEVPPLGPVQARNPFALESGAIDQEQFAWLRKELDDAEAAGKLALAFSHHPDLSFAEFGTFGFLVPGHVTAAELDGELASHPNFIAWIAGHTHRNRIRPFRVDGATGTNGDITAPVACSANKTCTGFWQIETASLIDAPQEARIIEVIDNGDGTGKILATLLEHGFDRSKPLADADDRCQFYLTDPASVQQLVTEADLTAICTQGGTRTGEPGDRNVELFFKMPTP